MNHLAKRIAALFLILALTATAVAALDDETADDVPADGQAPGPARQEAESPSIATAIREHPELETLARLFEDTGYLPQLEEDTRITFFAPSDAAFERLGEETVAELFRDRGALDVVMRHHLAFGASPLDALRRLDALTTLEGTRLRIDDRGDQVTVDGVGVDEGRRTGNGVLYVVDRLLVPEASTMVKDLLGGPSR